MKLVRVGWLWVNLIIGYEEFFCIDLVVICLVYDGVDCVVLVCQVVWLEWMFLLLVGFVEVGELFEVCVVWEICEEIGLIVCDVCYLGSQLWLFLWLLMVGFYVLGDLDEEFLFSDGEIVEVVWFICDEVCVVFVVGDWFSVLELKLLLFGLILIVCVIIELWVVCE